MEYLRPKTIDEALDLLDKGIPLAGGTQLSVERHQLARVIDLQSLGLDQLEEQRGVISLGAMARLQALMTTDIPIPEALRAACRLEAAWNLRNQATLGGVLMAADGRSPLLTTLAALDPAIQMAPGDATLDLLTLNVRRQSASRDFILLGVSFRNPSCLSYDFVSRAPMDPPLVATAVSLSVEDNVKHLNLALGGVGGFPVMWTEEVTPETERFLESLADQARAHFKDAGDAYASAEYRSDIAGVLLRRVVSEVLATC